jgi:hypothetical protein
MYRRVTSSGRSSIEVMEVTSHGSASRGVVREDAFWEPVAPPGCSTRQIDPEYMSGATRRPVFPGGLLTTCQIGRARAEVDLAPEIMDDDARVDAEEVERDFQKVRVATPTLPPTASSSPARLARFRSQMRHPSPPIRAATARVSRGAAPTRARRRAAARPRPRASDLVPPTRRRRPSPRSPATRRS